MLTPDKGDKEEEKTSAQKKKFQWKSFFARPTTKEESPVIGRRLSTERQDVE